MKNYIIQNTLDLSDHLVSGNLLRLTKEDALYRAWADYFDDGDKYLVECDAIKFNWCGGFLTSKNRLLATVATVKSVETSFEEFLNTVIWA
jgi:hypothetical protein